MKRARRRVPGGPWVLGVLGFFAVLGWWQGALLVVVSALLAAGGLVLIGQWRRHCLGGVSYERQLGQHRALFGEEVSLVTTVTNDKLLPLSWLHVEDELSSQLTVRGGVVRAPHEVRHVLVQLMALMPYQQVTRHMTVVCDRRGEHRFGPVRLRSGDPVGWGSEVRSDDLADRLLVYPKVFPLVRLGAAARLPLGPDRAARLLLGDPSRVAGVRPYRPGDSLRHVDWRATARSREPLVRIHEPTASPRAAVFLDTRVPQLARGRSAPSELELTIAVAASVLSELHGRGVAIGLFSNGSVDGRPIALGPRSTPDALADALELLAKASPFSTRRFADVVAAESAHLPHGTSVIVVAADFPRATEVALSELRRRRVAVTTVGVLTDEGQALPPAGLADVRFCTQHHEDWTGRDHLDLVA